MTEADVVESLRSGVSSYIRASRNAQVFILFARTTEFLSQTFLVSLCFPISDPLARPIEPFCGIEQRFAVHFQMQLSVKGFFGLEVRNVVCKIGHVVEVQQCTVGTTCRRARTTGSRSNCQGGQSHSSGQISEQLCNGHGTVHGRDRRFDPIDAAETKSVRKEEQIMQVFVSQIV